MYKLKPGDGGNPPRYKARIVVKGFQQKKDTPGKLQAILKAEPEDESREG